MILEGVSVGAMEVNCYILASKDKSSAIIIDPGDEFHKINEIVEKHNLSPKIVINTHGHYDHIGCDDKFSVPVYVHKDDIPLLRDPRLNLSALFGISYSVKSEIKPLEDNDTIELEEIHLKVIHVPGHTPGGIALFMDGPQDKIVFTGDTLFFQGVGRSDLNGGNEGLLTSSIRNKLFILPEETVILPGHGLSSTIGQEKRDNPFLI